jgi:hypothetical protein
VIKASNWQLMVWVRKPSPPLRLHFNYRLDAPAAGNWFLVSIPILAGIIPAASFCLELYWN